MADLEKGVRPDPRGKGDDEEHSSWLFYGGIAVFLIVVVIVGFQIKQMQQKSTEVTKLDEPEYVEPSEDVGLPEDASDVQSTQPVPTEKTEPPGTEKPKGTTTLPKPEPQTKIGLKDWEEGGEEGGWEFQVPTTRGGGSYLDKILGGIQGLMQAPQKAMALMGAVPILLPILRPLLSAIPLYGMIMAASGFILFLVYQNFIPQEGLRKGGFLSTMRQAGPLGIMMMLGLAGVFCWGGYMLAYPVIMELAPSVMNMVSGVIG